MAAQLKSCLRTTYKRGSKRQGRAGSFLWTRKELAVVTRRRAHRERLHRS